MGLFFVWYSVKKTTAEEREILWNSITSAKPFWVILSALIGILSHLSRAYRWQFLAKSMHYNSRLYISFMSLMMGYLANLGIPRSGEILRATTISSYEGIPFQKTVGTIISERIVDLIMLLIIVALGIVTNTSIFINYFEASNISPYQLIAAPIIIVAILYFGYVLLNKIQFRFFKKVQHFISEVYKGIRSILQLENRTAFIAHTIFIWGSYILMFYCVKFAIPQLSGISFGAALAAFIAGSFAMTVSNGGLGVFPVAIGAILVYYDVNSVYGESYGWVLWTTQTVSNLVIGGTSFLVLPFFSKKK